MLESQGLHIQDIPRRLRHKCEHDTEVWYFAMLSFAALHFFNSFVAFYKEIYEANMQTFGQIMRFLIIFSMLFQFYSELVAAKEIYANYLLKDQYVSRDR